MRIAQHRRFDDVVHLDADAGVGADAVDKIRLFVAERVGAEPLPVRNACIFCTLATTKVRVLFLTNVHSG